MSVQVHVSECMPVNAAQWIDLCELYISRCLVASGPVCLQCGIRRQGEACRVVLQHWLGCLSPVWSCNCIFYNCWHCETAVQAADKRGRRRRLPTSSTSGECRDAEQWQWWWRPGSIKSSLFHRIACQSCLPLLDHDWAMLRIYIHMHENQP